MSEEDTGVDLHHLGKLMQPMAVKRLQIMIDEDVDAALGRQASEEGVSKAALIRRYVVEGVRPLPPFADDPLAGLVGLVEGNPDDSVSVDQVVCGARRAE